MVHWSIICSFLTLVCEKLSIAFSVLRKKVVLTKCIMHANGPGPLGWAGALAGIRFIVVRVHWRLIVSYSFVRQRKMKIAIQ